MTTILIVDPSPKDQEEIGAMLGSMDFTVMVAGQASAALEYLDDHHPDLVLLDEAVNDLTPEEFLSYLQNQDRDTFTIIVSRRPELSRGMLWIASGAFAYLGKPLNPHDLREIINKGLENKEAYHQVVAMAQELNAANQALIREKAALKEKTEDLRFLYDLGLKLSSTLKAREVVGTVAEALHRLAGPNLVVFLTAFDPADLRLYPDRYLKPDLAGQFLDDLKPELGQALSPTSFQFTTILPDRAERGLSRRPHHRVTLPLIAAGQTHGLVGLYYFRPPDLSPDRNLLLKSVALQSAQALFNAHQHEAALGMASHDPLTGLFNRRAFDENLSREFERFLRYGADLALIALDLDHFKSVNDHFGHQAGDEVLKSVAAIIRQSVRGTDMVARVGGEEFAVLLPGTDQTRAMKLARRIEKRLRQTAMNLGDHTWWQTVSQGLADTRDHGVQAPEDLVNLADRAMYLAKNKGRNTIRRAADLGMISADKENVYAWPR